jgi:DhnA family fructose-bisphosphate aldolase class Ia
MNEGERLRLGHIFSHDGRAVVVAADHGAIAGPLRGIESPGDLVRLCSQGGADAILAHRGFVRAGLGEWGGGLGFVLRTSGGFTTLGGRFEEEILCDADDALFWGADAAAVTVKFGHAREGEFIKAAARLVSDCGRRGLPVMIEAMAFEEGRQSLRAEALAVALRAAEEIGASFIKAPMPEKIEDFTQMTRGSHVPILLLGGERRDSLDTLFGTIAAALERGAAGIAMGRNIWGQPDAPGVLEGVVGLVHGGWNVEKALARVRNIV